MNKKVVFVLIILVVILLIVVKNTNKTNEKLTNDAVPTVTPAYNPSQEIKYDSNTDLTKELENVNPEVLDSDFE